MNVEMDKLKKTAHSVLSGHLRGLVLCATHSLKMEAASTRESWLIL